MFGKNDVYVVFRVGSKKVKTHHIKNAGKHASFGEILTMNLSDSDLEHGIDVGAYDYDVGSSDDLLGQGKLVNLLALKRTSNQARQFKEPFKYKGKARGEFSCVLVLRVGGVAGTSPLGAAGGKVFAQAMGTPAAPPPPAYVAPPAPPPVPVAPPAPPPVQPGFMVVTCPANARGGLQVVVQAPDGQQLQVQIPPGVGPGGQFRVPLPPPRAPQPPAVAYAQPQVVQPQPVQYAAQPAYAPQPTYAAQPAYAPQPGYAPQMGQAVAPQPVYAPQMGQPQYGQPQMGQPYYR